MILPEKTKYTAFEAAQKAATITLQYFRKPIIIENKETANHTWDPVTQADREAEQAIRGVIAQNFPDHNILGEEYGLTDNGSDYCWVIDPIDGTRAFITGLPVWGTLIGLMYQQKPIWGLMAQPFIGEILYGDGQKTYYLREDQEIQLTTSTNTHLAKADMLCTTPDMFNDTSLEAHFNHIASHIRHVRYGTDCYGYASLAMGYTDIVFETGLSLYDYCALQPITEGAGGIMQITATENGKATVLTVSNKALLEKIKDL